MSAKTKISATARLSGEALSEPWYARPLRLAKVAVPNMPFVFISLALHILHLSKTSTKWDIRMVAIVALIRAFLGPRNGGHPSSVGRQQAFSVRDPGVPRDVWISRQTIPGPDELVSLEEGGGSERATNILDHLKSAIDALMPSDVPELSSVYSLPALCPIEVEWTAHRSTPARKNAPPLSENESYTSLLSDPSITHSNSVILYIHGGAMYLMDPASTRPMAARLSRSIGAPVVSVRYRLAPQDPFPAAVLDCFVAYLALVSPPTGSIHAGGERKIILAGDSAGGNLCLALLQLILTLHRLHRASSSSSTNNTPTVRVWNTDVPVPLPTALALQSPWTDLTQCLPSNQGNAQWDYLPPPPPPHRKSDGERDVKWWNFPADDIWPAKPPRAHLYCHHAMLTHPLVSPLSVDINATFTSTANDAVAVVVERSTANRIQADWKDAPPIWLSTGEELLTDEGRITARHLARDGCAASVAYLEFEAMPHVFSMLSPASAGSKFLFDSIGTFVREVLFESDANDAGESGNEEKLRVKGTYVEARSLRTRDVDVRTLLEDISDEEVVRRMKEAARLQGQAFEKDLALEGGGEVSEGGDAVPLRV